MLKQIKLFIKVTFNSYALFFGVFVLFSCQENTKNTASVFRYNEHKNIGSLDPAFAKDNADIWAINQLFNGLVQMDEALNVQPCIAKSINIFFLEKILPEMLSLPILNTASIV